MDNCKVIEPAVRDIMGDWGEIMRDCDGSIPYMLKANLDSRNSGLES